MSKSKLNLKERLQRNILSSSGASIELFHLQVYFHQLVYMCLYVYVYVCVIMCMSMCVCMCMCVLGMIAALLFT